MVQVPPAIGVTVEPLVPEVVQTLVVCEANVTGVADAIAETVNAPAD